MLRPLSSEPPQDNKRPVQTDPVIEDIRRKLLHAMSDCLITGHFSQKTFHDAVARMDHLLGEYTDGIIDREAARWCGGKYAPKPENHK